MTVPHLTLATIQRHATDQPYTRGQNYFQSGAVISVTQRQQVLQAEVEGNEPKPYRVTIHFDSGGVTRADCTCQYSYEGWCKHVVATLLTCVRQPQTIEQRPTLEQLLDQLNWVQTQEMVQNLVAANPELIESVDFYVSQLGKPETSAPASPPQRQTSIDPMPFKRRAREILRHALSGWEYGQEEDEIADEMGELIDRALAFVEQGDVPSARVVMQGITEGCAENWSDIDDFCGLTPTDVGLDLDTPWTEILLSDELTVEETLAWQEHLEAWQDQLDSFAMALEALRQTWDYPPLVKVFAGEITAKGAWSGPPPAWAGEFSQIRLKILARQERYEDYLHLAEAEGQTPQYLSMLAQVGRIDDLMKIAPQQIGTLADAKAVAETLRSHNHLPQALEIALQGLRLEDDNAYNTFDFATWTSDLAEGLDNASAALEARILAFKAQPSLKDYQTIETLVGSDWPQLQADLLQYLRAPRQRWGIAAAQVEIFLQEGLLEDAIAVVSELRSYDNNLIMRVMDAVIDTHSQWVIQNARPRAESIMNEGKAQYYHHAVEWLKRVKAAYQALGKPEDWHRYHQQLTNTHGRKRKLIGLMKQNHL
ncbi:MAG: SWIM zinc finger family protein [Cyanobacteria bacterium P01_F01_bin.86]